MKNININDKNIILEKFIKKNKIQLVYGKASRQIREIWLKLFNEELSPRESTIKVSRLKNRGFKINLKKDVYLIFEEYIINNNVLFRRRNISKKIKEIWLKLFDEELSLAECKNKAYHLRKRGFKINFKRGSYSILKEYINKNNILFTKNKVTYQIIDIWFKLFNENLSKTQSKNKIDYLQKKGFKFYFDKDLYTVLEEYITNNNLVFTKGNKSQEMKEIWFELFNKEISKDQGSRKFAQLKERGFKINFGKDSYTILEEFIDNNNIFFTHGDITQQMKEIWFKLFNKKLNSSQINVKISNLKKRGFNINIKTKRDSYTILKKYLIDNNIVFKPRNSPQQIKEIWLKLFNEKLSIKQSKDKISNLRRSHGFILKFEKDNYTVLEEYLTKNKILFTENKSAQQMKKIWLELFNQELSLNQSRRKIRYLREKGFEFAFDKNSSSVLSDYLVKNNIIFSCTNYSEQFKEIWFKLFNEQLSTKQCTGKISRLKAKGFKFNFDENSYTILKKYIVDNKILFTRSKTNQLIKDIWFKLFNEQLSTKQCTGKISRLKAKGFKFNFKENPYTILKKYIVDNKILFTYGKSPKEMKIIWNKLFDENLTLVESKGKIKYLKDLGFKIKFRKDSNTILEEYLVNNKIIFTKAKTAQQMKDIWFKLFDVNLSLPESRNKINYLRNKRNFQIKIQEEKNLYVILENYLIDNNIHFTKGKFSPQMKKIWFELFNVNLSLKESSNKIRGLRKRGFQIKLNESNYSILEKYLIKNETIFNKGDVPRHIKEIWFELFNEEITLTEGSIKFSNLKKRGFPIKFHLKKDYYAILINYLVKNKILFTHGNTPFEIKEIWKNLFNEELSIEQSVYKLQYLKRKGYKVNYKIDSYNILIQYLKKSNIWIEESEKGYKYLKNIWEKLFDRKINLKDSELIFSKISLLSPQCVNRKILLNIPSFEDLYKLTDNKRIEYINIFGLFCRKNKISLSRKLDSNEISRIWSVCFAANK